jgi:hypothetical protein
MKLKMILPGTLCITLALLSACKKEQPANPAAGMDEATARLRPHTGPQAVNLGLAGTFTILSKSGITNVYQSSVTGDVGTSPITGAALHLTCAEVAGNIYTVNAAGPLPCRITNPRHLTTSISNMEAAYTDAAGRSNPNYLNLGAGNIGGLDLPGFRNTQDEFSCENHSCRRSTG